MYCDHFGLRCRPFEDRVDPQFTYITADVEEALAALEYEVHYGRGIALITGGAGTGKTQLLRTLLLRLRATDHAVVIAAPSGGRIDLLREACKGFAVSLPESATPDRAVARLRRHLGRGDRADQHSVLIVDQAENLSRDNIAQITMLNGIEGDGGRLSSIILIGQPRLRQMLEHSEFAGLRQQMFGSRTLAALSPTDVAGYIHHRLSVAGAGDSDLFDADATVRVHEVTRGVPRVINQICNAAMLAAYGAGERRVTAAVVAEVTLQGSVQRERALPAADVGVSSVGELTDGATPGPASATGRAVREGAFAAPTTTGGGSNPLGTPNPNATEFPWGENLGDYDGGEATWDAAYVDGVEAMPDGTIDRLERALARAERITATTEASMQQFHAVEKHLAALTADARRLTAGLGQTMQRGRESLDQMDERLTTILDRAEWCASHVETQTDRFSTAADQAARLGDRVEQACEQAHEVEERLAGFVGQLAEQVDDVQDRTARVVACLDAGQEMEARLSAATQWASGTITEVNTAAESAEAKFHAGLEDAKRSHHRFAETQVQEVRTLVETARQEAERSLNEVQAGVQQTRRAHESFVDASIQASRATLKELATACERSARDVIAAERAKVGELEQIASEITTEAKQRIDHLVASTALKYEADVARRIENLHGEYERFEATIESMERRHRELDDASIAVQQRVTATVERITRTDETRAAMEETISDLTDRAEAARGQLLQTVEHGEKLIASVHSARGQAEEIHHNASTALVEIGRTSERVAAMRSEALECERIADRIALDGAAGAETLEALRTACATAGELRSELQSSITLAAQRVGQITDATAAAARATTELGEAHTAARATTARLVDQTGRCNETLETARGHEDRLSALASDGRTAVDQLTDLVTSAAQLHDALQGLVAHSDDKISRLGSHHAAAKSVLTALGEMTKTAHELIKKTTSATQDARRTTEESSEKINGLLQDVWSLTAKTEVNAKTLTECGDRASGLIQQIERLTDPTQNITADIAKQIDAADERTNKLNEGCQQAAKLVDRLNGIARLLDAATETEESVRATAAEVQATHDVLAATIDEAVTRSAELQKLNGASKESIAAQTQSTDVAHTVLRELAERLGDAQGSIETADRLLGGFLEQAEALGEQLQTLTDRSTQIDERVTGARHRSEEMVKTAAAQAGHLEQVCATVRRVYAGISQATIDAREQMRQLQATGHQTNERLSTLNGQTQRAAGVLREWVEEAVRVQTRLDHTLRRTPGMSDTHSTDALFDLSRSVDTGPPSDSPTARGWTEPTPTGVTEPTAVPASTEKTVDKSDGRAQVIARMIDQAKRAGRRK